LGAKLKSSLTLIFASKAFQFMLLMGFLKPRPRGVFSYNCCSEKPFRLIIEEKRWQLHYKTVGKGVLHHASRQKLLVSDDTQHAKDPVSLSGLVC